MPRPEIVNVDYFWEMVQLTVSLRKVLVLPGHRGSGLDMAERSNWPSGLRGEFREKGSGKLVLRSLNPVEFKATTK